jgi:hypothetical protein
MPFFAATAKMAGNRHEKMAAEAEAPPVVAARAGWLWKREPP